VPCASVNPNCKPSAAPELDISLAAAGISLLGGTLAVVRARRRK
jgi:LPXTG-motif cell wall-anchored protein